MTDNAAYKTSEGIETLITRLRSEGVAEGQAEADKLVSAAEKQARDILKKANDEANSLRQSARTDAERFQRGGEEALKSAMRDAVLQMKEQLGRSFAEQVRGTVSEATRDEETLKRMILAVAARARDEAGLDSAEEMEVLLPREIVGLKELQKSPEKLREGSLSHFVTASAAEMLRDGVTFGRSEDDSGGISIQLEKEGMVLDLTDSALAGILLRHLQPRFRALLEGVVG